MFEQCGWAKLSGRHGLTDFDPLVRRMALVAFFIGRERLDRNRRARKIWCEAMRMVQDGEVSTEHNTLLPCRSCDRAFRSVIDETLLVLFLAWYPFFSK